MELRLARRATFRSADQSIDLSIEFRTRSGRHHCWRGACADRRQALSAVWIARGRATFAADARNDIAVNDRLAF